MLYNIVLASAIHQHETVIGIHICPLLLNLLPTPFYASRLSQSTEFELQHHRANFHWLILSLYVVMYVSTLLSQFFSPSPSLPCVHKSVCCLCLQCCPADRFISTIFLDSIHVHIQLCLTLCDPLDYSLSGSSLHGIFQARILEWVIISFSRRSS